MVVRSRESKNHWTTGWECILMDNSTGMLLEVKHAFDRPRHMRKNECKQKLLRDSKRNKYLCTI